MTDQATLIDTLPDLPRWVEARALLLHQACEVTALRHTPDLTALVRDIDDGAVFVIGRPTDAEVRAAIQRLPAGADVIAPAEAAGWLAGALPEWRQGRIRLYTLPDEGRLPAPGDPTVGVLDPGLIDQLDVEDDLREELAAGAEHSPIATVRVHGRPVSFCYAGALTERWWDVAVDTIEGERGKGYAGQAVAYMVHHYRAQGRAPVWQALEDNPASWRLALKLGFTQVDDLVQLIR